MALHSMCQPGRPGPNGESHVGSSGADGCHSTKSSGLRWRGSSGSLPARRPGSAWRRCRSRRGGVGGPGGDVEPGGALDGVGVAAGHQDLDEGDHLRHPLGGLGLGCGGPGVEGLHVTVEPGRLGRGQLQEVDSELAGLGQDRVVDVGDVAHQPHLVAEVLEAADQQVVGEVGVGVPEVGAVVRGDAAHVDPHLFGRRGRLEGHHRTACGVVQTHEPRLPLPLQQP